MRAGQFVKPFGFDIQHSSSVRESPERGTTVYGGLFNSNRFFNNSNRQVNYNFRIRRVLEAVPLALGASVQLGRQLLPEGVADDNRENVYGADLQFVVGRLGVRAEYAAGNMPSTLLELEPEFGPGFLPGFHSAAGVVFSNLKLTEKDHPYWRYDQFNGDPVSRRNINAFNFGYLRRIGVNSRIAIDYQFKNRVSFNNDEVNTKL